jgi:hypothetical protein
MKQITKSKWVTVAALMLALPTAWFIFINVLNEIGISGPYSSSLPILENMGIKKSLGLNINLLILFGPLAAGTLTAFQVLKIDRQITERHFHFHLAIRRRWFPILVGAFSISLLAVLSLYLVGENCHCK